MSPPRPHDSSFLVAPNLKASPYKEWVDLVNTVQEYDQLLKLFIGIPTSWIQWTETRTQKRIQEGLVLEKPLSYRLDVLWNGIIALQEIKFICDVVENALRQATADFVTSQQITYSSLLPTVPGYPELLASYERTQRRNVVLQSNIEPSFIFCWSFYQLTETIKRNWTSVQTEPVAKEGFRRLNMHVSKCRNAEKFHVDMRYLRDLRNDVAHSRRLFQHSEAQEAFRRSCTWLDPLNVALSERVLTYRKRRPNFLESLRFS